MFGIFAEQGRSSEVKKLKHHSTGKYCCQLSTVNLYGKDQTSICLCGQIEVCLAKSTEK